MQVGRFLVHVYHRRHDIFPSYPANEEICRPLEERLYLFWGFPLEELRAGGYQRIDKACAILAGAASGLCQCRDCWRTVPFAVRDGLPAVLPDCLCVFQIVRLRVVP